MIYDIKSLIFEIVYKPAITALTHTSVFVIIVYIIRG